jgi:hypothetical protein
MKKPMLLAVGAEIVLIATAILYRAFHHSWIAFFGVACAAFAIMLLGWFKWTPREASAGGRTVGVGTVCGVDESDFDSAHVAGERQVFVEVVAVSGETFIGKLVRSQGDPDMSVLRPGLVVLVAFDPAERERLSLPDDVLAVRAKWVAAV